MPNTSPSGRGNQPDRQGDKILAVSATGRQAPAFRIGPAPRARNCPAPLNHEEAHWRFKFAAQTDRM